MGTERSFAISRRRRGFGRAAAVFGAVVLLLAGCGRSGHGADTDSEKASDVEYLNTFLAQELTALDAYAQALPRLRGRALVVARQFRGQDQAHLDAITKAIRGIGGETDAEAGELETPGPKSGVDALLLLYDEESAGLDQALDAVPHMATPAPGTLAAALAASHAQHVAVLRQLLGGGLAASVPEPFETGSTPAPVPPVKAR
jgi:ABC-type transporter Mla subunit MlaD